MKTIITICLLVITVIAFTAFLSQKSYDSDCMFKKFPEFKRNETEMDLRTGINLQPGSRLKESFPYPAYLAADNWKKVSSVRDDMKLLDSLHNNREENINVMFLALTDKLPHWKSTADLDSLNLLLNWAEPFNTKSVFSDDYDILYQSVHNYWIDILNKRLDSLNQSGYSVKFNCKFRYLRTRCCQLGGDCGSKDSNMTKVFKNLIDTQWFYLFNRFLIRTSVFTKLVFLALIAGTVYGYICIIQKHIKINRK